MHPGTLIGQSQQKLACIRRGRADPEVNVLRKHGCTVENAGLTADQQTYIGGLARNMHRSKREAKFLKRRTKTESVLTAAARSMRDFGYNS